jgi:hypothetical protein
MHAFNERGKLLGIASTGRSGALRPVKPALT